MPIVDYLIIVVILVSALVGIVRGFLREAISLGTWIVAIWVAYFYAGDAAQLLEAKVDSPVVRLLIASAALFIGVLLLGALVGYVATVLVKTTGLTGTDRTLGMAFGGIRGVILLALLLVMAVGLLPVEEESWWQESRLIPYVEQVVVWLREVLPPELADYLDTGPDEAPETVPDPAT